MQDSNLHRCVHLFTVELIILQLSFQLVLSAQIVVSAGFEPAMLGNLHVLCVEQYDSFYIDALFS